jgi:hypothetical protein
VIELGARAQPGCTVEVFILESRILRELVELLPVQGKLDRVKAAIDHKEDLGGCLEICGAFGPARE